jgi:transcriptional regulator with PAS, ATPase and Fis domain
MTIEKAMNEIDDKTKQFGQMLEGYESPAILVSKDYEILATNKNYQNKFGDIDFTAQPRCYAISHGYDRPCDQAGEDCPLLAASESGHKEKVLHIHQTPNGQEHVDVEMVPIFDDDNNLNFFIELLTPVPLASGASLNKKIVGKSQAFEQLLKTATRVAKTDADVLLLGESGTGKELISHLIHLSSERSKKAFVTLECSGLSETLIESELFGHKKGSFTGANNDKKGIVEHADGGTLFLDEIGDVSLETQVKLLRLIESKTFRRVGETEVRTTNFRLICATHRNLKQMVDAETFRLDLYYRINVFPIHVPSLKERIDDLPDLIEHIIKTSGKKHHITASAIDLLSRHEFPGNIRELKNIVTRALVLSDTNIINKQIIEEALTLGRDESKTSPNQLNVPQTLQEVESNYWQNLVAKHGDDKEKIAHEAGISLRTLYRKLKKTDDTFE